MFQRVLLFSVFMLKRTSSLLFEKRFPHCLPYIVIKKLMSKRVKDVRIKKLMIALTFDIENDPLTDSYKSSETFLKKISKLSKRERVKSTFFVQGNLISRFANQLQKLQIRNEIGLHGFAHELWGNEKWWLKKSALKFNEKRKLLELSLEEFHKCELKKPVSFRAPNMVINEETIKLLSDFGFKVDSSLPSYEGILPIPLKIFNNLISIPVSVNPEPKISFKLIFPYCFYEIFNMKIIASFNEVEILNFVKSVVSLQKMFNYLPHIVFLAHPWEFTKIDDKKFEYCTERNYKILKNMRSVIEKEYKVEYMTMNELKKWIG